MPRSSPLALLLVALCASTLAAEPAVLKSPTGKVLVSFSLAEDGAPLYSVTYAGKPVVAGSRLGLTLRQTGPLASGFRVLDVKRASRDEKYTLVAGKTREARDRCEEMTVSLEKAGDKPVRLDVVFRAFDDGAAFRYVLPKQAGLDRVEITSEDTRFRFLADHRAWVLELGSFTTSNEREFVPMSAPRHQAGVDRGAAADDRGGRRPGGGARRGQPAEVVGPAPRPRRGRERLAPADARDEARSAAFAARRRGPRRPAARLALARAHARGEAGRPRRVHDPHEPRRPQRDRRHLVDQAGEGRLGLVERARRAERAVEGRHEQRDVPPLHRLRRGVRPRVRARRRRLVRRPPGRRGRHHGADPRDGHARPRRLREGEERLSPRLAQLGGGAGADGRGLPPLREVGPGRREDRLHGPQGPGDRRLLPARHAHRGEVPPHGGLPRRLRRLGRGAHLPELADPRGRDGPRVQQVERPGHSAAQRDDPLHPDADRPDGLHARRASAT